MPLCLCGENLLRTALLLLALVPACSVLRPTGPPHLTHGIAVGEVTTDRAVVWGRCDRATSLRVEMSETCASDCADVGPAAFPAMDRQVEVGEASDFTGTLAFDELSPATRYAYRVWCGDARDRGLNGVFRTAPDAASPSAVRFAWGGDVAGQNVCRDRRRGFPIFPRISGLPLDFFLGLGDMIYADDACLPIGRYGNTQILGPLPATDLSGFRAHWRYNRADAGFQRLLAMLPYYGVWDDHEIRNDSGPHDDDSWLAPGGHLLPIGLQAFLEYQPLARVDGAAPPLYRSLRWGKHLEIFVLDTRRYRDATAASDSAARPKTMLGAAQLAWLEDGLARSDATWKVLVASVPLSIPTGSRERDGFADGGAGTGYEREAARLFAALRERGIRNSLWITTDVHFATGFAYQPFADDPSWASYEFITGPLNAGVFPNPALDSTFQPQRLFMYAPRSADAIASFDEAIGWFNFGVAEIDSEGTLRVSVVNGRGETVFEKTLRPES